MKKQILILALFVMAIFAGVNKSYGQALHDSSNDVTTCTSDALHPMAGKLYNYAVTATGAASGGNFTWWATQDPNFIAAYTNNMTAKALAVGAGKDILVASAAYGAATTNASVDITWSSTILANTGFQGAGGKSSTFVAVQYDNAAGSCSNNLKVYEIKPVNGFIVDILNLNNATKAKAAYGTKENQCIDNVKTATYSATTHDLVYDYGTNIFYYEIVAANFSETYKPFLTLTGLDPVQIATIEWTYDKTFATGLTTYASGTTTVTSGPTDNSAGVSIYVKITVVNHNYEGVANKTLTLALDATNKDDAYDVKNSDCSDPKAADKDDKALQDLKPRPTITGTTTSTSAPTVILPGNESNDHSTE